MGTLDLYDTKEFLEKIIINTIVVFWDMLKKYMSRISRFSMNQKYPDMLGLGILL